MRVGVIGAGRMGLPIVGHLVNGGHEVVVHDLDPGREQVVTAVGGSWVASTAEMAASAEIILICVGYDNEGTDIMCGEDGVFAAACSGCIVAILSTVMPDTVTNLAAIGEQQGVSVVDTTVCRGGWEADAGTLLSFVGGPRSTFDRLREIVGCYSSDVVHCGPVGTAQVCKAANNLILWACLIADHEALALADRFGVDVEVLRQALLISSATNGALSVWGQQTMAWAEDDMVIVRSMAAMKGVSLPQAGVNAELCRWLKPRRYSLADYGV